MTKYTHGMQVRFFLLTECIQIFLSESMVTNKYCKTEYRNVHYYVDLPTPVHVFLKIGNFFIELQDYIYHGV